MGVANTGPMGSFSMPGVQGPTSAIGSSSTPVSVEVAYRYRFLLQRTMSPCPVTFAGKLRQLVSLAQETTGLSHDIMTENAGRCIAQLVHQVVDNPGGPVSGVVRKPRALVFVGNNVTGMRAAAGARHLLNHGWEVRVSLVRPQFPNEQTEFELGRQAYRLVFYGSGLDRSNSVEAVEDGVRRGLDVIIDAIHGPDASQRTVNESKEVIYYLARAIEATNLPVISVGMPSGIHGSKGTSGHFFSLFLISRAVY